MADYPELRKVLGSPYRNASAEDIENFMERLNLHAEDTEDFLGTLGNIGKGIVGVLPQVLPAALPVVGAAIGGPIGGMVGSFAGKALGSAISPGRPATTVMPVATPPATTPMPGPVPLPQPSGTSSQISSSAPAAATPPIPGSAPAAGDLLRSMFRPETLQALIAMLLGQAGKQNIPVGDTPVPVGAFTNMISTLANQAAAEYSAGLAAGPHGQRFTRDFEAYAGESYGDTSVPEVRAAALLELFRESDAEHDEAQGRELDYGSETDQELDELYDEMDEAELYAMYQFA